MESASAAEPVRQAGVASEGDKGLKAGALGFLSNVVIGVASTAPGYSLAAVLGFVAIEVGFQSPAILWLAFIPMLFISAAYYYMNRADPDCGTSFTWLTNDRRAPDRLDDGLGDHHGRPLRDGQPGPDRRASTPSFSSAGNRPRIRPSP